MPVIPPDLLDRIRRLEEDLRELRGRLPAQTTEPRSTTRDDEDDEPE
ncbi:hypothetical protein [Streptomyces boncukensis]|uniref:Uncharacterized protein n=1 Tax=Streptomyces boncukensis TaxID=2711219 RepID=A0A6G4X1U5_9ACTN|nr:hypothetical protein [Streptomyces boncukensis]NGO70631.1 hypothetical protein [Streptomyces boncukensis]